MNLVKHHLLIYGNKIEYGQIGDKQICDVQLSEIHLQGLQETRHRCQDKRTFRLLTKHLLCLMHFKAHFKYYPLTFHCRTQTMAENQNLMLYKRKTVLLTFSIVTYNKLSLNCRNYRTHYLKQCSANCLRGMSLSMIALKIRLCDSLNSNRAKTVNRKNIL